jgi:hypothetical protein
MPSDSKELSYLASYPFVACSSEQLTFVAGDVLMVEPDREHCGWVFARHDGSNRHGGWVPLSYLVPLTQPPPDQIMGWKSMCNPAASDTFAPIKSAITFDDSDGDEAGFGGEIMGGTNWASSRDAQISGSSSDIGRNQALASSQTSTNLRPGLGKRLASALTGVGTNVRVASKSIGDATGTHVRFSKRCSGNPSPGVWVT